MAGYLPSKDGDMLSWLGNFQTKITTHGPTLGLLPAEVTALQTDCTNLFGFIQAVEGAKTSLANAVAAKEGSKKTDLKDLQKAIARMKTHSAFTDAIGEDLGIMGGSEDDDLDNEKVDLSGKAHSGFVRLKFKKNGFTGVKIFARLKGTTGWTFLALDTESPYDDHRPLTTPNQPEEREYKG